MIRFYFLCWLFVAAISCYASDTDVYLNKTAFCVGDPVIITSGKAALSIEGITYKLFLNSIFVQEQLDNDSFTLTNLTSTSICYFELYDNDDNLLLRSVNKTILVHPLPVFVETRPNDETVLNSFDDALFLNPYYTLAEGETLKISSSRAGVQFDSFGSRYYFSPAFSGIGGPFNLSYTLENQVGCSVSGNFTHTIYVGDPYAPWPSFLRNITPLPICETSSNFKMEFISDNSHRGVKMLVRSGNQSYLLEPYELVNNPREDNYIRFELDLIRLRPSVNTNYVVSVQMIKHNNELMPGFRHTFSLFPKRKLSIQGLPSSPVGSDTVYYCSTSTNEVTLKGSPEGGSFEIFYKSTLPYWTRISPVSFTRHSIKGFTSFSKDPFIRFTPKVLFSSMDTLDYSLQYKLVYKFPSVLGAACPEELVRYIKFQKPAGLNFSLNSPIEGEENNRICHGDPLVVKLHHLLPVATYSISYGDGYSLSSSQESAQHHYYTAPGKYSFSFKASHDSSWNTQNPTNCSVESIDTIFVGAQPIANFEVYHNQLQHPTSFLSTSTFSSITHKDQSDSLQLYSWKFGDNSSWEVTSSTEFQRTFSTLASKPEAIQLITTSSWGCVDTILKAIPIFPILSVSANQPYLYTLDSEVPSGWFESGTYSQSDTTSSWTLFSEDTQYWSTREARESTSSYYSNERSSLESPLFNLHGLKAPMISFYMRYHFDPLFDGASLQYCFPGATFFGQEQWHTLGEIGQGISWYTSPTIIAKPGNQLRGWTGTSSEGWNFAAYSLEALMDSIRQKGHDFIRFRFALATNSDNTPGNYFTGIDISKVFIGEQNRNVVAERFCDYRTCDELENEVLNNGAVSLQYHLRTEQLDDDLNNYNRADNGARALFYGINSLPELRIDGRSANYTLEVPKRRLLRSPFQITTELDTSNLEAGIGIRSSIQLVDTSLGSKALVLTTVIVEHTAEGNGTLFHQVVRRLLPNAAGIRLADSRSLDATNELQRTWFPSRKPSSDHYVVSFLQDEQTKEIYQATIDTLREALVYDFYQAAHPSNAQAQKIANLHCFPNPASNTLTIQYEVEEEVPLAWVVVDLLGKTVLSGFVTTNESANTISTASLPYGIYLLKLSSPSHELSQSFSIVR